MFIAGNRRSTHSLLVLLVMLLGLTAAPAALAAQDDDDGDDTAAPTEIVSPDEDAADTDDADLNNQDAPDEFIMPDEADDADQGGAPPDCDDDGWRIVTTEDNAAFESEDHCDDHVARYGTSSIVTLGAGEENEYVAVTLADPTGDQCRYTVTLVNGQDGQVVNIVIYVSDGSFLASTLTTADGEDSFSWGIRLGQWLERGTADLAATGEAIPIHMPNMICG